MLNANIKLAKLSHNILDDLLFLSVFIIIWTALVYFIYRLNGLGLIISTVLAIISFGLGRHYWLSNSLTDYSKAKEEDSRQDNLKKSLQFKKWGNYILALSYIIIYIILIRQLLGVRSDQSLISPWQVIKPEFFGIYATAVLILALLLKNRLPKIVKICLSSSFYLVSLAIAIVVYKIGYGFDPFIHQAAMTTIDKIGLITPKTPYYLGVYGLIITLHKISGLAIADLNRWLVPAIASLFLPVAGYNFLKKTTQSQNRTAWLTILFIPILTFAPFISTTPQNLSYLFLILTVLAVFTYDNLIPAVLLALATAAIHPLTGLPALMLIGWLVYYHNYQSKLNHKFRKLVTSLLFISSALILPLTLVLAGGGSWTDWSGFWSRLSTSVQSLIGFPSPAGQENAWLNFAYFLKDNHNLLIILLIVGSLFYWQRWRQNFSYHKNYKALTAMAGILTVSYLVGSQLNFKRLIAYEQSDYINRLPVMIVIFLLPLFLIALNNLIKKIFIQSVSVRIIWLLFALICLTASLYISYPRYDNYFNSHGFSTGAADITAVKLIAQKSSEPYIVLADQPVSAAALKELGFSHYYKTKNGPMYFYPIPTGGPLYQYYLDMVYQRPARQYMAEATNLIPVKLGYLVINSYWYRSNRLIKEAKLTANNWWNVDGQDYIFQYKF